MILCFLKPISPDNVQITEEDYNNSRKQSLRWSLGVVTVLWTVVGLIVAINIGANGSSRFYGPTGLCELIFLSCMYV
jgi:hypothetical protein